MTIHKLIVNLMFFVLANSVAAEQVRVMSQIRMIENSEIEQILIEVCSDLVKGLNGTDESRKEHKYFIQFKSQALSKDALERVISEDKNWLAWDDVYNGGQEKLQILKKYNATLISFELSLEDTQYPIFIIQWAETELAGGGLVYIYQYNKAKDGWELESKQVGFSS